MDCYVEDPMGNIIYRETKKQYDSFTYRTEVKGVYQFCFSNEFSTFSHKTVYFDFQVGDEPPILPDMGNRVTALTQVSGRDRDRTRWTLLLSACSCFSVLVLGHEQESPPSFKRLFPSGPLFLARALPYRMLLLFTLPNVFFWPSTSFKIAPCTSLLCDMLRL